MTAEIFDLRAVFECKRALHEFNRLNNASEWPLRNAGKLVPARGAEKTVAGRANTGRASAGHSVSGHPKALIDNDEPPPEAA